MNPTSPAQTGTTGAAIAALAAVLSVMNKHWNLGITPEDLVAIASGIPMAVHWLAQQYALRQAALPTKAKAGKSIAPAQS